MGIRGTGLESALLFLRLNGYRLQEDLIGIMGKGGKVIPAKGHRSNSEILIGFTLEMASGEIDLEETQLWFKENMVKI